MAEPPGRLLFRATCGITVPGARGLRHPAINDQCMAVVHEPVNPVARLDRRGIGRAGEQGVGMTVLERWVR